MTETTAVELAKAVDSTDPEIGLRAVAALRKLLERLEELHVVGARSQGWSWQEVADVLQVSRQAVHKKHAARTRKRGGGRRSATGLEE